MIEQVKQDYIDNCTAGGFVRKNTKHHSKVLLGMGMLLTIVLVITYSIYQYGANGKFDVWANSYVGLMLLGVEWSIFTFVNFKLVINKIPGIQVKWNVLNGPSEQLHFKDCARTHMETHFIDGTDLKKDKIELYLSYLEDMQVRHKYDGYFEKGLLAALGLTIWGAFVTKLMEAALLDKVFLLALLLCGMGLIVVMLIIFIRSTFGSIYTEVRNLKSYTYSQYRSAILNFYASKL